MRCPLPCRGRKAMPTPPSLPVTIVSLGLPKAVSILTSLTAVIPSISYSPLPPITPIFALGCGIVTPFQELLVFVNDAAVAHLTDYQDFIMVIDRVDYPVVSGSQREIALETRRQFLRSNLFEVRGKPVNP